MAESPSIDSHRSTVDIWPAWYVGNDQLGDHLRAADPFGRVREVLDGQHQRSVGLVPVGGSQVQFGHDLGFHSTKLAEQEFSKEAVVPVPLAPAIERDQERVRSLEPAQLPLCARLVRARSHTAERTVDRAPPCDEGTSDRSRATGSTTRDTDSPRRIGRLPRSSAPRPSCRRRREPPGTGRPASLRCVRSPPPPVRSSARPVRRRRSARLRPGRAQGRSCRSRAHHPTLASAVYEAVRNGSTRSIGSREELPRSATLSTSWQAAD